MCCSCPSRRPYIFADGADLLASQLRRRILGLNANIVVLRWRAKLELCGGLRRLSNLVLLVLLVLLWFILDA